MRAALERLDRTHTSLNDPYYLVYRSLFADLRWAADTYASGKLLDIGCGNKPYVEFFQARVSHYLGCDIAQSDRRAVDLICAATHIPLRDQSHDTVFSTQVIEHVSDHRRLLAEAHRVLKPGGYLILSAPMCWEHHEEPYDFFRFTKFGLQYLLDEAGFEVVAMRANGGKWALVGQMLLNSWRSSFEMRGRRRRLLVGGAYSLLRAKWLVNLLFGALDRLDADPVATLNFVVVARR
jgi:SAM-dependent methyltransferase